MKHPRPTRGTCGGGLTPSLDLPLPREQVVVEDPSRKKVPITLTAIIGTCLSCVVLAFAAVHLSLPTSVPRSEHLRLFQTVSADDFAPHDWHTNDRCVVYTYFEERNIFQDGKRDTFEAWKEAWSAAGWKPMVLDVHHAARHPDFHKLQAKFQRFPFTNDPEYEMACFFRHIAMAAVGGGYLSDWDVINVNVPPSPDCRYLPSEGRLTVHNTLAVPSLTTGSESEFNRIVQEMSRIDVQAVLATFPEEKNLSDMIALEYLKKTTMDIFSVSPSVLISPFVLSTPPCDIHGVQLPILIHFSHQATEAIENKTGEKVAPDLVRGKYMREWRQKILGDLTRCKVLTGHYQAIYFPSDDMKSPLSRTMMAFDRFGQCLSVHPDCGSGPTTLDYLVGDSIALLKRNVDANGAPVVFGNSH